MKKIVFLILALAMLLCGCGNVDFEGSAEEAAPIEKMMNAALECDGDGYLSVFPPQMTADYEEKKVFAVWFGLEDARQWLSSRKEEYEEAFGKDITIEAEVVGVKDYTPHDVEDMNPDPYTYVSYVTSANTQGVCAVTVKYTIGGDSGSINLTKVIYTVNQGGKWYVHPIHAFDSFGN